MASLSATDYVSQLFVDLAAATSSFRLEFTFLCSFAGIWLISKVLGLHIDQLLGLRHGAKMKPAQSPVSTPEGTSVSRPKSSTSRATKAYAPGIALPVVSLEHLEKPSTSQLHDARWVFAAVLALSRALDQEKALDLYKKAHRVGMTAKTLCKSEGSQLFMILVTSAIRLGRHGEALALLRHCRVEGPGIYPGLLTSATKLATAGQHFKECLALYDYVVQDPAFVIDDRVVWSCLLFSAVESRSFHLAMPFWGHLKDSGEPTFKDFGNMVRFCSAREDWRLAIELLAQMQKAGHVIDRVIYNTALAICVAANRLEEAVNLLEEMETHDGLSDVITYNTLAKGYAKAGQLDACFELCVRLRSRGLELSQVTYGILLDCCVNQSHIEKARQVFDHMVAEGCEMNTVLYTTMIKGLSRAREVDEAMRIYDHMRANTSGNVAPDVITFSILIKANCDAGRLKVAIVLLETMAELKLVPDEVVYNNLLGGCLPEANVDLAKRIYSQMFEAGVKPSTATFSILIRLYTSCKMMDEALDVLTKEGAARGIEAAPRLYLQLVQVCLRDRQGRRAVEVYRNMPQPASAQVHEQLLFSCTKLNMLETGAEILDIASKAGGVVDFADAEKLREVAVRKKRACTKMIEDAMERLHLTR